MLIVRLNFQIFVTMATEVDLKQNFTCTFKFADHENPMFGARIGDIFPIETDL